jgi:crotonobetainyl-CoA:carnitine CoA-transferase CaiB-like acyl-CoA transferase
MTAGVLDGVRVLDFGRYIAVPYCACLLGDIGAEVIRIERVGGGEDRLLVPLASDDGGAIFLTFNRNKKSLTLEPATPEGPSSSSSSSVGRRPRITATRCGVSSIAPATGIYTEYSYY